MSAATMFKRLIDPADPSDVKDFYVHFRPTIPMDRALLCLDCEAIFEAEGHQTCPACGSSAAWAIGRALNRAPRLVQGDSLRNRRQVAEALAHSDSDASEPRKKDRQTNGNGRQRHGNGHKKANGRRREADPMTVAPPPTH